jgi:hypothetical protein
MIGYVQGESFDHWFKSINDWVAELARTDSAWLKQDCLTDLRQDTANRIASCVSMHVRVHSETGGIHLEHLWIDIRQSSLQKGSAQRDS